MKATRTTELNSFQKFFAKLNWYIWSGIEFPNKNSFLFVFLPISVHLVVAIVAILPILIFPLSYLSFAVVVSFALFVIFLFILNLIKTNGDYWKRYLPEYHEQKMKQLIPEAEKIKTEDVRTRYAVDQKIREAEEKKDFRVLEDWITKYRNFRKDEEKLQNMSKRRTELGLY